MKICNKSYDITPVHEFYLIGYGSRFESRRFPAKGVHDSIFMNVLVMECDHQYFYLCNIDFIELEVSFCEDVKKRLYETYQLKKDHVLLSVTHNHQSVRDYHTTWETGVYHQQYDEYIRNLILDAYSECFTQLEEVEVYWGKSLVEGFYGNRNHPGRLADNEVIQIEFRKNGICIAGIINWAVHSTFLSPENAYLTSELAGYVRRHIAKQTGYMPLMIVGAAGDCSTRHFSKQQTFDELETFSEALANQILQIPVNQLIMPTFHYAKTITYPVVYSMNDYRDELEEELVLCEQLMGIQGAKIHGISPAFYKKCIVKKLEIEQVDITLFSTILDLGELKIITIPGELGSVFGLQLKQLYSDVCTIISGYTNGFLHYMMPKEEYGLSMETIDSLYPKGSIEEYINYIQTVLKPI